MKIINILGGGYLLLLSIFMYHIIEGKGQAAILILKILKKYFITLPTDLKHMAVLKYANEFLHSCTFSNTTSIQMPYLFVRKIL